MRMSRRIGVYSQGGILWLFDDGDQRTSKTGGWTDTDGSGAFADVNADSLSVRHSRKDTSDPGVCYCKTANQIDLSAYKTLYVKSYRSDGYAVASIPKLAVFSSSWGTKTAAVSCPAKLVETIYSLDVSSITGSYYIGWGLDTGSTNISQNCTSYAYEVWAE